MYSWTRPPVPRVLSPTEIGEPYKPPVDNRTTYACCDGHCSCANLTYGHCLCSYSRSSLFHTTSSHPHGPYRPSSYLTRVPYHVAPCRPLRHVASLTVLGQRGVAQEKWSCDWPRSCLTYGLVLLALPVIWSVRRLSLPGDVIQDPDLDLTWNPVFSPSFQEIRPFPLHSRVSSTWNHPTTDRFPYGGQHHWHANGQSSTSVHHWNMPFQWAF